MKTLLYICNPAAATNANISSSSSTSAVVGLASTSFAFYNNAVTELNFKAQGDNNDENPNVQCVDAFLTEDKVNVNYYCLHRSGTSPPQRARPLTPTHT